MAPRRRREGPAVTPGLHQVAPALLAEAGISLAGGRDGGRELEAWGAAVEHLHSLGLPAAVPEFAAAWLARRGVHADWTTAA